MSKLKRCSTPLICTHACDLSYFISAASSGAETKTACKCSRLFPSVSGCFWVFSNLLVILHLVTVSYCVVSDDQI